ncbi:MAG: Type 1 glutamine amidotransferase-like domain-containing protein [Roseiflexaceae bacterium]|nr:Type 1 glutamine amidotransferase-like domain-containing protein [Roseiflexaceae bacterium]
MSGAIMLAGGAEFGGRMAEVDRAALELAGGVDAPVRIIPAAAAPDNNHDRAGQNGVRWFRSLGARDIAALALIDTASANDVAIAAALRAARLIYLLGGFTGYLGQTLAGSEGWRAALDAHAVGALIAGSSAGAMVLCEWYYDPSSGRVVAGLGLVPNACVLPHHNTFGKGWAHKLSALLPAVTLVGIDERTGMISAGTGDERSWSCYGQGAITLYQHGQVQVYAAGVDFRLGAE